ncbi:hypothetical protein QM012_005563 [Aureobasidium pullulans]|uniref:Uncharacterized protein n=1 Tax=Aureobasidium pullulans TaxID=5580 RepID=A0ABR0T5M3_AURPU
MTHAIPISEWCTPGTSPKWCVGRYGSCLLYHVGDKEMIA